MTRAFTPDPVAPGIVDQVIDAARRSPSAGNTQAVDFLVLEGVDQVQEYWAITLPVDSRADFPWPGLLEAPVLIVEFVDPHAYAERYGEPDKAKTGLGTSTEAWATPYWWVDGGMAAMALLLAVEEAGLGALFFGVFEHEQAVKEHFGVPAGRRAIGAIAVGRPTAEQRRSVSVARGTRDLDDVLHRGRWRDTSGHD